MALSWLCSCFTYVVHRKIITAFTKLLLELSQNLKRSHDLRITELLQVHRRYWQWRNGAPGAPATPEGDVLGGRQIVIKMWDNFATLTARLAKVRVLFSNLFIYLDFSAILRQITLSKLMSQGRHWGATFCRRGAPFRLGP